MKINYFLNIISFLQHNEEGIEYQADPSRFKA